MNDMKEQPAFPLTKRELIAAMAMQGILSNPHLYDRIEHGCNEAGQCVDRTIAEMAILKSEAFFTQLSKRNAPEPAKEEHAIPTPTPEKGKR